MTDVKKHVLLVDDEIDFLDTISFWLQSKGYDVKVAHSGKEALSMIAADEPYLVFLDINMPQMSGIEILENIRKTNPKLPVIMVTAAYNAERMAKAQSLGISGFFPKNESLEDLAKLLEVTLRRHKKD